MTTDLRVGVVGAGVLDAGPVSYIHMPLPAVGSV